MWCVGAVLEPPGALPRIASTLLAKITAIRGGRFEHRPYEAKITTYRTVKLAPPGDLPDCEALTRAAIPSYTMRLSA